MDLVTPHFGIVFWTVLNFLLLLFVLKKLAWKPMLEALDAREKKIKDSVDQARVEREAAQKTLADAQKAIAEAHKQASDSVERARKEAEAIAAQVSERARTEAAILLTQAREQIERERDAAVQEIRTQTVDLAVEIARKIVGETFGPETHKRLVDEYLRDFPQAAKGARLTH